MAKKIGSFLPLYNSNGECKKRLPRCSLYLFWAPDSFNCKFFSAIKRNLYTDKLDINQLKVK